MRSPLAVLCLLALFFALSAAVSDSFCQSYSSDRDKWKSSGYYCSGDTSVYCSSGYVRTEEYCQYGCSLGSCDAPRYCEATKTVASPLCGTYVPYRVDENHVVSVSDGRVQTLWDLYGWVNFTYYDANMTMNMTASVNFTANCDLAMLAFSCYEIYEKCTDHQLTQCKDQCKLIKTCRLNETTAFLAPYGVPINQTSYEELDCSRYCKWGASSTLVPGAALLLGLFLAWFSL